MPWDVWVNGGVNILLTLIDFRQPGRGATLHTTYTISPTVFNQLILGVSQDHLTYNPVFPYKVDRTKLGVNVPQFNPSLNAGNLIPNFTFGGVQNAASVNMSDGVPTTTFPSTAISNGNALTPSCGSSPTTRSISPYSPGYRWAPVSSRLARPNRSTPCSWNLPRPATSDAFRLPSA